MKFAPKIWITIISLSLTSCALPVMDVSGLSEPKIIIETGGGFPNPAQTTWSTPEPTATVQETKKAVDREMEVSASCTEIDPTLVFRFERSLVKCPELRALRAELIDEVGEQHVDAELLDYHERYCTEHGGGWVAEPLPRYTSPTSEFHEKPVDPNRDLDAKGVQDADSLEMNLGAYTPCLSPDEIAKQ